MRYEIRKVLLILVVAGFFMNSAILINRVFSYDTNVAHPVLTEKIAQTYNNNFERKLTDEETRWLKQGSIEEDTPPRWLNHFYEPNINSGLGSFASAKNWAQSPNLQSTYLVSLGLKGNQTWQKAIEAYVKDDKKSSFIALGHTLHLIEDMAVPAHTRLDAHPKGDSYEKWAQEQIGNNIDFNVQSTTNSNLTEAFNRLAFYSNRYFLSEDTIINQEIIEKGKNQTDIKMNDGKYRRYILSQDSDGRIFKLIRVEKTLLSGKYSIDGIVNADYFSLLGPKAVSYGAGVIKLFFEEAEKRKKEEEQKSWWDKTKDWFKNNVNNFSSSLLSSVGNLDNNGAENMEKQGISVDEQALGNLGNQGNQGGEIVSVRNNEILIPTKIMAPEFLSSPEGETTEDDNNEGGASDKNREGGVISENKKENLEKNKENQGREGDIGDGGTENGNQEQNGQNEENNEKQNAEKNSNQEFSYGSGRGSGQNQNNNQPPVPDTIPPETNATSALFSNNQTIATSTAIFEFSSSETNSTFECQLDNAISTRCVSPLEYNNLADGSHIFKVWAIDQANNLDLTPMIFSWTIDATAPNINLELLNHNLMSINFSVRWNSSSTDVSSYEIQYRIGQSGQWQDWASGAAASQKSFRATHDDTIYYFRGRATDGNNNQSAWQEMSAEISLNPVAINEIAWMGTSAVYANDEWIEIYNKTNQDINLNGWALNAADGTPSIILSGTILAHSFYLLERTNDNSISDISADQIYTGALINTGESLELRDTQNNLIDSTPIGSWPAGETAPGYKTMEKINPYISGLTAANWATNNSATINGLAADGITQINGTPKTQNSRYNLNFSASTTISSTAIIGRDTIWTLKGSPYLLESNYNQSPTLSVSTTLIIEPGVIIKPQNKYYPGLIVKGTLLAQGVVNQQIKFTSKENSPQAGDWGAIVFETGSDNSILDNVIFEYGVYKSDAQTCYMQNGLCQPINGMVMIYDSSPQIKNSTFQYSQYDGIWLNNSDANINNCFFSDNLRGAMIRGANSQSVISGSTFQNQGNSGIGIAISDGASPSISSNNISGYSQAIYLESAYPIFSQNTVSNNSYNGIYVSHQSVFSQNATWQNDLTYLLMSNSGQYPTIATGTVLIIEPGVVIKPLNKNYTALKIEGRLTAEGTGSQKIVFTAFGDDSFGGDSNNDSNLTAPGASGEWKNILFINGSRSSLKNINFKYGGFIPFPLGYDSNQTLEIEPGADVVQGDGVLIE